MLKWANKKWVNTNLKGVDANFVSLIVANKKDRCNYTADNNKPLPRD